MHPQGDALPRALREIIRKRRLGFLYYIVKQNRESLIAKVFEIQCKNPTQKDWVTTVKKDLEEINLDIKIEDIKNMEKYRGLRGEGTR